MLKALRKNVKGLFTPPTPLEKARKELIEAKMSLLEAQSGLEWASITVEYNTARINRLTAYINVEGIKHQTTKTTAKPK